MEKKSAGKRMQKEETVYSHSYYSYDSEELSEDEEEREEREDAEATREERDRAKDRAKFRGNRADLGDSISSSDGDSPCFEAFQLAKKIRQENAAKKLLQPTAKKRPEGSAVANRKKTRETCSEPSGAAVAGQKKRRSCSERSGAAVAGPPSRSAAVAGKKPGLSCSERSGAHIKEIRQDDVEGDVYSRRDSHQNFGGIE